MDIYNNLPDELQRVINEYYDYDIDLNRDKINYILSYKVPKYLTIERYGFRSLKPAEKEKQNDFMPIKSIQNIKQCIENIPKHYNPFKKKYKIFSYSGKSYFEKILNTYITNGEFIIAMILCGYEYRLEKSKYHITPNCFFKGGLIK